MAEHRLVGGDRGKENERHDHPYRLEVVFEGDALDERGYLIDISVVEPRLDALRDRYRGQMLNDLPEFAGKNPGIEQFASILAERLTDGLAPGAGAGRDRQGLGESNRVRHLQAPVSGELTPERTHREAGCASRSCTYGSLDQISGGFIYGRRW